MSNRTHKADELSQPMQLTPKLRIVRSVNACLLMLLSVIASYLVYNVFTAMVAAYYGVFRKLQFDGIVFIDTYSRDWNFKNVFITFLSGYLVCVAAFVFFHLLQINNRKRPGNLRIVSFYLSFAFLSIVISQIVLIPFSPLRGLGVITEWLYWSDSIQMIVSVSALVTLPVIAGYLLAKPLLQISSSFTMIKKGRNRRLFYQDYLLIPVMVSFIFMLLLYQHIDIVNRLIIGLVNLIAVFSVRFFSRRVVDVKLPRSDSSQKISLLLIILFVATLFSMLIFL